MHRGNRSKTKKGPKKTDRGSVSEYHLAYGQRNSIVRDLSFVDYRDYLNSDLWRGIRSRVLTDGPECWACGNTSIQVHHGRYNVAVLRGLSDGSLYAVCGRCHKECEFTANGEKRSPREATEALKRRGTRRSDWAGREIVSSTVSGGSPSCGTGTRSRDFFTAVRDRLGWAGIRVGEEFGFSLRPRWVPADGLTAYRFWILGQPPRRHPLPHGGRWAWKQVLRRADGTGAT